MPTVTVQGVSGTTVSLVYDSRNGLFGVNSGSLAQAIANLIDTAISTGRVLSADNAFGTAPALPTGKSCEFVISSPGVTAVPRGYDDVVVTTDGAQVMGNGDPNEAILIGPVDVTFRASGNPAGAGTVAGGGGTDTISIPATDLGNWLISAGNGNDMIFAAGGGNDTIVAGAGNDTIQLGSGDNTVYTNGAATIEASSGSETVTGVTTDVIYGNASALTFIGTGSATVYGGTGTDTVTGGSGQDLFYGGTGGNNVLRAGSGPSTLFGGGNGDSLYANGTGGQILYAGNGNETLTGSPLAGAADTFVGSSGSAAVAANPLDTNIFEFIKGSAGGTELVTGLTAASQVTISLSGYGPSEVANAIASQQNTSTATTVQLSDGTTVTFQNITHLTNGNFT